MKLRARIAFLMTLLTVTVFGTWRGNAFALLGPFQSWMQPTNGLDSPGDIGGPMCISNGYRWNVPVVTYGFDKSFINFFGTNGEAAVESAIQVLNDLPPASQLALTNYPFDSMGYNYPAQAEGIIDLKSYTLSALLEQLGLTQPEQYIFVLKQWNAIFLPPAPNEYSSESDWPSWVYPDYISERNFDPQTLEASHYVNNTVYTAFIETFGDQNYIVPESVDPFAESFTAVVDCFDNGEPFGGFYVGLTCDDVGGLRYLFSTNNVAYETLLPGITGAGTNAGSFVNGAWRPGIDKITFVPQSTDPQSGAFLPTTNCYTDTYITNGVWVQQQLARVVTKPDFLFCAADLGEGQTFPSLFNRSGTTNWINNAALNGNPGDGGPGMIQPPVKIVFDTLGPEYLSGGSVFGTPFSPQTEFDPQSWASFDGSTNPPIIYPAPQTGTNRMTVRLSFSLSAANNNYKTFELKSCSPSGTQYALQTSTDLLNWTTLFMATNNGSVCTYVDDTLWESGQYYRLVSQ